MKRAYKCLVLILAVLLLTLTACGKNTADVTANDMADDEKPEAVQKVEALIDAIGDVSEKSGDAIQKAEREYRYLSPGEQALVSNHSKLLRARDEYSDAVQVFILGEWYYCTTATSDDSSGSLYSTKKYLKGDTIRNSLLILEGGQGEYHLSNESKLMSEPWSVKNNDVTWTLEDGYLTVSYSTSAYGAFSYHVTVYKVNFIAGALIRVLDNTVLVKQE